MRREEKMEKIKRYEGRGQWSGIGLTHVASHALANPRGEHVVCIQISRCSWPMCSYENIRKKEENKEES